MSFFYFSDYRLSTREECLLSLGLNFCLPCYKPSFARFFAPLELLFSKIVNTGLVMDKEQFRSQLSNLTHDTFNNLTTQWAPYFKKSDMEILRNLSKNKDLHISRPDKGRGVVLLNKADYVRKVNNVLSDSSKFKLLVNKILQPSLKLKTASIDFSEVYLIVK